jgi:ankyrin repeat protein
MQVHSNRLTLIALFVLAGVQLGAAAHKQSAAVPSSRKTAQPDTAITSPLVADAAEQRSASQVHALIQRGRDVNQPQADGGMALHWAAHWDDLAMAQALINAGARPNVANDYGVTPLFLAAENGSASMVEALLKAGADPNAALPSGETVLMSAVRGGNPAAVKQLLARHANPNAAQISQKQTALMWAVSDDRVDIVSALLEAGADIHAVSSQGTTPLMFAARTGDIQMARSLIAAGDQINASANDGTTPLLIATVKGHPELALFFLDQGADADGNFQKAGYTPLMWAVATFDPIAIVYKGGHVDGEWGTFSGISDRAGQIRLVKSLIARGAEVNARLAKGIPELNPNNGAGNKPPHVGATPFLIAAQSADAEMMRLLLAYGADPFVRAGDGQTAIMAASEGIVENTVLLTEDKRIAAIQVGIDLGLSIEDQDTKGFRPMHVAARGGYHDVIKFLLARGAEKNPLTKPYTTTYSLLVVQLQPQSPLGIVEGTIDAVFQARPVTAAFLRGLGFESIGRYVATSPAKSTNEGADKSPEPAKR